MAAYAISGRSGRGIAAPMCFPSRWSARVVHPRIWQRVVIATPHLIGWVLCERVIWGSADETAPKGGNVRIRVSWPISWVSSWVAPGGVLALDRLVGPFLRVVLARGHRTWGVTLPYKGVAYLNSTKCWIHSQCGQTPAFIGCMSDSSESSSGWTLWNRILD